VGFITLFFAPPIGFLMLMVSGFLSLFGKKKIPAFQGACPHCAGQIVIAQTLQAIDCPLCKSRVINNNGRFSAA